MHWNSQKMSIFNIYDQVNILKSFLQHVLKKCHKTFKRNCKKYFCALFLLYASWENKSVLSWLNNCQLYQSAYGMEIKKPTWKDNRHKLFRFTLKPFQYNACLSYSLLLSKNCLLNRLKVLLWTFCAKKTCPLFKDKLWN